jgi:hypothetical protein
MVQGAHLTADSNAKYLLKKNGMLNRKWNTFFNTVWKLPWLWCSMKVTLYKGQSWIWRWNHLQTVGEDIMLNINDYCCPMWRIYWLTDKIWITFHPHSSVAWPSPKEV